MPPIGTIVLFYHPGKMEILPAIVTFSGNTEITIEVFGNTSQKYFYEVKMGQIPGTFQRL